MILNPLRQSLLRCLHSRLYSMELSAVVGKLNSQAPLALAESWDNVGLLVEPYTKKSVRSMLLTNDLTESVLDEAEQRGADLILSYHPPIFRPLKKVTLASWKERIVARCLEHGIAVYSPHTAHDALKGGVNDWLISAYECQNVTPLEHSSNSPKYSHRVTLHQHSHDQAAALERKLKDQLNTSQAMINVVGSEMEVHCKEGSLPVVVGLTQEANPHTPTYLSITKLEKVPAVGYGSGRRGSLAVPITVTEAVDKIKAHVKLPHVRVALAEKANMSSKVHSVSVCAGSGSSVLRGSRSELWVTGEMSHHEVLDATHAGTTVILTDHSNSERGYLTYVLRPRLTELLESKVEVLVSEKDRDPLQVV